MMDVKDSLAEWFGSCFVGNQDFTLNEEEILCNEGATCFTYKVRRDGRLYLLKRLKPEFAADPRFIVALQKEFYMGNTLSHPTLVKYMEASNTSLLMEYVNGRTLTQLLEEDPTYFNEPEHAERFLSQLTGGVEYMHEHHVLHLDLKPDNVMITHLRHDVRIIDLGFCYTDCYDNTRGYTRAFAAPEQIGGGELTEAADIYAIGRILEWVNGKVGRKIFPASVIRRCTAECPGDRFSDCTLLLMAYHESSNVRRHNIKIGIGICAFAILMVALATILVKDPKPVAKLQMGHPGAIMPDSAWDGVYVMDWEGRLVDPESWDTAYQALGVALLTSDFQARIALQDCEKQMVWGPDGLNLNVVASSAEANDDGGEGMKDYAGEYNTYQFIHRQSADDTTALYAAYHFLFPDGSKGYLPALGEMEKAQGEYGDRVNEALIRCGGTPIEGWHWTSTQKMSPYRAFAMDCDKGFCFAQLRSGQSFGAELYGLFRCKTRPFGAIKKRVEEDYTYEWGDNSSINKVQEEMLMRRASFIGR